MSEYRTIDLSEWVKVGEGGNGVTYENSSRPDVILKVNKARINTPEMAKHEYDVATAVQSLGLNIPGMFEIVMVGDNVFGTIQERIKDKRSLSRICHDQPERTEEMARVLCKEVKALFATPCNTKLFPSRKEQLMTAFDKATFIPRKYRKAIRSFAESVKENDNCVHGDMQSGNLIEANGRYYWIDLDRFAHGDPMFDIGHLYLITHFYAPMKRVQEIFHMSLEQFQRFWDAFAKAYTGKDDHGEFDLLAGKFAGLDMIIRINFEAPSFAEKLFFRVILNRIAKKHFQ